MLSRARLAVLFAAGLSLLLAAPAGAITRSSDATALANAALRDPSQLTSASWDVRATNSRSSAIATESLQGFPADGSSYLVLSSGDAGLAPSATQGTQVNTPNANYTNGGGTRGEAKDVSVLRLNFTVPAGNNCMSLKFRYFSEEWPEFLNQGFNDGFLAELDPSSPWTMSSSQITAPANFAFMPGGAFVSINSATMTAAAGAGTVYDGGTDLLTASAPVTGGAHSLVLSVWDDGDTSYDSAAFVDDVYLWNAPVGGCVAGATVAPADTTAPETSLTSTPGATTGPTAAFGFTADEASTYECRVDGGSWAACTSTKTLTGLSSGSHTFEVRATDSSGNVDATPASYTWTVDATPPDTTLAGGPSGTVATAAAGFTFTADESGSTFECKLDLGAWATCTSPAALTGLADGSHTFSVRATDALGNVDGTPDSRTWTVDTTAPDTSITSGPTGAVATSTAAFGFTSPESGVTFECKRDAGGWTACTSPQSYSSLAEGAHSVAVRAVDGVGNADATPATRAWSVDTVAPSGPTAAPAPLSSDPNPTIAFTGEPGATYECRVNGGTWSPCTSPLHLTGLTDGPQTLELRETDAVGNQSVVRTYGWTVDTSGPAAPAIIAGPIGTVAPGRAPFALAGEPGSTFQCRVDGGAWATCTASFDITGLAVGAHTIEVRQIDGAGNVGPAVTRRWTVAAAAPKPPVTADAPTRLIGSVGTPATRGAEAVAVVSGADLPVGCSVGAGAISSCTVKVYVGGKLVGIGTAEYGAGGTHSGRVQVRLSRKLRARIASGSVKARFVFRAKPLGGDKTLEGHRRATLAARATWILPSDGLFESGRARLVKKVRRYLRALAPELRTARTIRVEGHTDSIGTSADNRRLGMRRARSVIRELHRLGVHARMVARSRGESRPRATNATVAGRWSNRRVELRVLR
jgi:outer membrane protein OmpA-like peptidoglycan-associated protein